MNRLQAQLAFLGVMAACAAPATDLRYQVMYDLRGKALPAIAFEPLKTIDLTDGLTFQPVAVASLESGVFGGLGASLRATEPKTGLFAEAGFLALGLEGERPRGAIFVGFGISF